VQVMLANTDRKDGVPAPTPLVAGMCNSDEQPQRPNRQLRLIFMVGLPAGASLSGNSRHVIRG